MKEAENENGAMEFNPLAAASEGMQQVINTVSALSAAQQLMEGQFTTEQRFNAMERMISASVQVMQNAVMAIEHGDRKLAVRITALEAINSLTGKAQKAD